MKKWISKVPILGGLMVRVYRRAKGIPEFTTSGEYWEKRYKFGGNSGAGSYSNLAIFKGEIINGFLEREKIDSVIEFGCGDGNQLKYLDAKKYLGFDVSETVINLCKKMYKNDKTKSFALMSSYNDEVADLTMSLDVIYHLIEDEIFCSYMSVLFDSSKKYVIVYSSNTNDPKLNSPHEKQRKFTDWVEQNRSSFNLVEHIPNKYPFNGDGIGTSVADFFIFKKKEQ